MLNLVHRYSHWLHGRWPDGTVEKLPVVQADGSTNIPGTYIVGDLTGVPLLKFSADTGAKAVNQLLTEPSFISRKRSSEVLDLVIIGGGVSGYSAALVAKEKNLNFTIIEANQSFSTIVNFPNKKPIYTYPSEMIPTGELQFSEQVVDRESLLEELRQKIAREDIEYHMGTAHRIKKNGGILNVVMEDGFVFMTHRVIVAIGRSGKYQLLNIPGENKDKVSNRLLDPAHYNNKKLLVVGGGDSALEATIASVEQNAEVTLSYRKSLFSRPKLENINKIKQLVDDGKLDLKLSTRLVNIDDDNVTLQHESGSTEVFANDKVLLSTGRQAPLDFFRRSKMAISGESTALGWVYFGLFLIFLTALYDWKSYGFLNTWWSSFSNTEAMPTVIAGLGDWWQQQVADRSTLVGTLAVSLKSRSFYYTLLYTVLIGVFGWQRIKRRNTPYVTVQTLVLFTIQLVPLFLLPEIILPWMGYLGMFDTGWGMSIADALFPSYISVQELASHTWPDWGHPRAYWHAYGFIFAWPLSVYQVFTPEPMFVWLVISVLQTFVFIPALVYKYGKGAYCSWICSCGAMAETMGDQHRHKMPHGPGWNKLNMLGQFFLLVAFTMLVIRILGWIYPESWMHQSFDLLLKGEDENYKLVNAISWKWLVDIFFAGVLGFGLYFKYSGRTWCRFACPLAALMHIYSLFSRFAIVSEKSKCISCNQCTSVCHQGIDVMSFANKGEPMTDPQCVRCSACIQTCPTGVLNFAEIDRKTKKVIKIDRLAASPVQIAELIEVKNV